MAKAGEGPRRDVRAAPAPRSFTATEVKHLTKLFEQYTEITALQAAVGAGRPLKLLCRSSEPPEASDVLACEVSASIGRRVVHEVRNHIVSQLRDLGIEVA